jgi:hypothetical protein
VLIFNNKKLCDADEGNICLRQKILQWTVLFLPCIHRYILQNCPWHSKDRQDNIFHDFSKVFVYERQKELIVTMLHKKISRKLCHVNKLAINI